MYHRKMVKTKKKSHFIFLPFLFLQYFLKQLNFHQQGIQYDHPMEPCQRCGIYPIGKGKLSRENEMHHSPYRRETNVCLFIWRSTIYQGSNPHSCSVRHQIGDNGTLSMRVITLLYGKEDHSEQSTPCSSVDFEKQQPLQKT